MRDDREMPACARATIAIHTGPPPFQCSPEPGAGATATPKKAHRRAKRSQMEKLTRRPIRSRNRRGGPLRSRVLTPGWRTHLDRQTNGTLFKQTLIGDAKEGKGGAEARNPRNRIPEEHHTRLSRRVRPGNDALHWRTGSVDPYASRGTCTTKGRCACTTNPSALRASERCVRWGTATERCPLAQCESRGCTTWYHRKAFQRAARVRRIGGTHICQ